MKFTSHERDEGLMLDYMLARYYGASMGRFLSVDPVDGTPGNPQTWNLYAYVTNNPVRLIDPTGETLTASGSPSAEDKFKGTLNSGLFGQEVQLDSSGNTTLVSTGEQGPPTAEQAALANTLSTVINDPANTSVTLSEGSATIVGSYATGDIDMNDVQALGTGPGVTAVGALGHEIVEQFAKQVGGQPYGSETTGAHAAGIAAENSINGSVRGPQGGAPLKLNRKGTFKGKITIPYTAGGVTTRSIMKIRNNNVRKVKRK
jgi:RHS repeat-associated protein